MVGHSLSTLLLLSSAYQRAVIFNPRCSAVAHTCGVLPQVGVTGASQTPRVQSLSGLRLLAWLGRQAAFTSIVSPLPFLFHRATAPFLRCVTPVALSPHFHPSFPLLLYSLLLDSSIYGCRKVCTRTPSTSLASLSIVGSCLERVGFVGALMSPSRR